MISLSPDEWLVSPGLRFGRLGQIHPVSVGPLEGEIPQQLLVIWQERVVDRDGSAAGGQF